MRQHSMMRLASASDENTCSLRAFVAQLAIEAFHEAVLLRLAGRDVVPFDAVDCGPLEHRVGGELGAVVRDDQQRLVVLREEPIEHADNARARQRGVSFGRETSPGELILDIEYAEATAAFEHVGDEVEHPDLVRPACRLKRRTRAKCPLAAPPPTNHQALLSIQPIITNRRTIPRSSPPQSGSG